MKSSTPSRFSFVEIALILRRLRQHFSFNECIEININCRDVQKVKFCYKRRRNFVYEYRCESSSIRSDRRFVSRRKAIPNHAASKALQLQKNIKFLFCPKNKIQPNINSVQVTMNLLIYLPQTKTCRLKDEVHQIVI